MRLARYVFTIAGIYGLFVLLPLYFLEDRIGRDNPPALTHPEYYYGFVGVAVAWQIAFLVIGWQPARFRPMMIPAMAAKASFGLAVAILFTLGRTNMATLLAASVDLLLLVLFALAYFRCSPPSQG